MSTVRIQKLLEAYDVKMRWVHFPLHPDTPAEGRSMADFYAQRGRDPHQMYLEMKARMDQEGLPYGERTHTYNSRLAQELGCWADTVDGGDALHDALFRAYFVGRRNIGDLEVLMDVVEGAGLDATAAREALTSGRFREQVDADWQKSHRYGVTGVPTFVAEGQGVVGAQPYDVLAGFLEQIGAKRRDAATG